MQKFCSNCGAELPEGAKFCESCGTATESIAESTPAYTLNYGSTDPANAGTPYGPVGFSSRVNDPEILAAVAKNRKASKIFAAILVPLPLIGFVIYSLVSDKMEMSQALPVGAIVSLIFLIFAVRSFIKGRASNTYEAVVVDKKTRERSDHDPDHANYYTEYITIAKTDDGKKKKYAEKSSGVNSAYGYLQIGDRFKYHPQFSFPYELYDKSNAPCIICVGCGTQNSVEADRCSKCNIPLLK